MSCVSFLSTYFAKSGKKFLSGGVKKTKKKNDKKLFSLLWIEIVLGISKWIFVCGSVKEGHYVKMSIQFTHQPFYNKKCYAAHISLKFQLTYSSTSLCVALASRRRRSWRSGLALLKIYSIFSGPFSSHFNFFLEYIFFAVVTTNNSCFNNFCQHT